MSRPADAAPNDRRAVALWLLACSTLLALLITVGGITRLTHSGLSIPEWRPVTGLLPPVGERAWEEAFATYRETPEYRNVNHGMSLTEYRRIYYWEYVHRQLARLLGLAFVLPFALFAWRRRLPPGLLRPLAAILAVGLLQGAVGWWMVASGLVEEPRVSHLRLAAHLGLALLLFVALLSTALDLLRTAPDPDARRRVWLGRGLLALVFIQALAGALMAGTHAGYLYPTFPRMAGELVPARLFAALPWPRGLLDDVVTIHFVHRWTGIAIAFVALGLLVASRLRPANYSARRAAAIFAVIAAATAGLGITTLLTGVAIVPAVAHQLLAVLLLAAATGVAHVDSNSGASGRECRREARRRTPPPHRRTVFAGGLHRPAELGSKWDKRGG